MKNISSKFYTLVAFFIAVVFVLASCRNTKTENGFTKTKSGLQYKIVKQGEGDFPKDGDKLWLRYAGYLANDSVFAESKDPLDIILGVGQVIKGWEEGLKLVKPGGEIKLIVPPELAYGKNNYKNIPGESTLFFDITLLQVSKGVELKPFAVKGKPVNVSEENLKYIVVEEGEGQKAQPDDNAYVHYTGYLPNGKVFDTSYKNGEPVRITVGINQVFKGWDMALQLMNKGSKYRFVIPADLAYGSEGYGVQVPPDTELVMDLEMVDLVPPPDVALWDITGKTINQTQSGLKYVVFDKGTGDLIKRNDIVFVNYSGYFTDSTLFDSSVKRFEPIQIPVGAGVVIDGWEEALLLMRKGAKFQLHIPSNLAYGEQGAEPQVPPNTDLVFDIEVLDFLK